MSIKLNKHSWIDLESGIDIQKIDFNSIDELSAYVYNLMNSDKLFSALYLIMIEFDNYDNEENVSMFLSRDRDQILYHLGMTFNSISDITEVFFFEYNTYKEAFAAMDDFASTSSLYDNEN